MIFETVSFHIVKPCNMKCKFCYATFDDMHVKQMSLEDAVIIIKKLAKAGVQKITFAGGEPLLYKNLDTCIMIAKKLGMTTSIITNGSLLTEQWLYDMKPHLDWIGISVDSMSFLGNHRMGRKTKDGSIHDYTYYELVDSIKKAGYKLKINTVVNRYNKDEDLNNFISYASPDRWKVFQALRIEGQNDEQFNDVKVSEGEFYNFLHRHIQQTNLVPENNEYMTGSYLLIDPQGRFFENSKGTHTYSDPLQVNEVEHCLSQIHIDRERFIERGGLYNWK
jgi:radical S-adenosyl methionine domain-containing protein 2